MPERYLRNDGQFWAKITQTDLADVNVVYVNAASGCLNNAEQTESKWRLARSSAAHDSNLEQRLHLHLFHLTLVRKVKVSVSQVLFF